jgi:hypothetical protein
MIRYNIGQKADVFAPGFYVLILLAFLLYTIFAVVLIEKKSLFDKSALLSLFILSPCFIYLVIHLIAIIVNVCSWIGG